MDTAFQTEASTASQLSALLANAGFAPLAETGWIRITGSDRARWLNGMLTNSIQALTPGQGCYNFALNSQGRIQGIGNVFAPADDPDALLMQTDRSQVPDLMAHLDHFIIMDDVELSDVSDQRSGVLVAGVNASSVLEKLGLPIPEESLAITEAEWSGAGVRVIRAYGPLVDRFEVWADADTAESLSSAVSGEAVCVGPEALECLRVLEGTPRYGVDIRNTDKAHDLPQETATAGSQSRALHFAKGCYLGQEIVERIRSRGNVHRAFSGFELKGALVTEGTTLEADGKPAGELTSVAAILLNGRTVHCGLGYVRREALERKLTLGYPGGEAVPVALPFRSALGGQI
jgi:aminomethyltransferase